MLRRKRSASGRRNFSNRAGPFVGAPARRPSAPGSARATTRAKAHPVRPVEVDRCPSAALRRCRIHNPPLWISPIGGVQRSASSVCQHRRRCGSPSLPEPGQPRPADDPEHGRIALPTLAAPLLDGQEAVTLGQSDCGLSRPAADAGPHRDGVDRAGSSFGGVLSGLGLDILPCDSRSSTPSLPACRNDYASISVECKHSNSSDKQQQCYDQCEADFPVCLPVWPFHLASSTQ